MQGDIDDYRELFLQGTPLMDTRAPIEFRKGAFPGAVNLPLMTDIERQKVGTCYKQQGQEAAIALAINWSAARPRPNGSRPGRPSPARIPRAACTASAAACVRRSPSSGFGTRRASPIRAWWVATRPCAAS